MMGYKALLTISPLVLALSSNPAEACIKHNEQDITFTISNSIAGEIAANEVYGIESFENAEIALYNGSFGEASDYYRNAMSVGYKLEDASLKDMLINTTMLVYSLQIESKIETKDIENLSKEEIRGRTVILGERVKESYIVFKYLNEGKGKVELIEQERCPELSDLITEFNKILGTSNQKSRRIKIVIDEQGETTKVVEVEESELEELDILKGMYHICIYNYLASRISSEDGTVDISELEKLMGDKKDFASSIKDILQKYNPFNSSFYIFF